MNEVLMQHRTDRFKSLSEAAAACEISPTLMAILESGGDTAPEIAKRVGKVMGLDRKDVERLTNQRSVRRRAEEARMARQDKQRMIYM